jgi:hypothetical protein
MINPIYKLVEYLNSQITTATTDIEFETLLTVTLDTTVNGYSIFKRSNPDVICPECPIEDCNGGTYFFGQIPEFITFFDTYVSARGKTITNYLCCTNNYSNNTNMALLIENMTSWGVRFSTCCNSFSDTGLTQYLRTTQTYYDENNITHTGLSTLSPYLEILSVGLFEYSTFMGDSALVDIIAAAENLPNDSFKFTFLMYLLKEGLVITCAECAAENGTINVMTSANFLANCMEVIL